jgi:glycosyltransferase involved in cell wall biosynthesis
VKIAYLGQMADVASENGISKKIRTQAEAWIAAGHDVRYFSLVPTKAVWPGMKSISTELVVRGGAVARVAQSFALARRIRAWRPDVIYFRYAYHSAGFPALFRAIPTVAEINSDDQTEYPITLSPLKVAYHRCFRGKVLRAAAGFVPVTRELGARFAAFGKPTEVIANSIRFADFPLTPPPAAPPSLVFVGSAVTPWHGLERAAEIAALLPEMTLDVVGCTTADWRAPTSPPASVKFHGFLSRDRYEPLVTRATAALGTLGLYKKQMDEACPLKVREYLALGLPVIAGYEDTDIPASADYFLRVPNTSASLASERDRLIAFCQRWRNQRVPRAAVAHLDTSVKETQRLAFLTRIAQKPAV